MRKIRLLPVVVMAIAALLLLKTMGLVTNGGYVLGGVATATAAGLVAEGGSALALAGEPTISDSSPTLSDANPTLEGGSATATSGENTAPGAAPAVAATSGTYCVEADATLAEDGSVELTASPAGEGDAHGGQAGGAEDDTAEPAPAPVVPSFAASMSDCLPSGDAVPLLIDGRGGALPLIDTDSASLSEQQLLERLSARRSELEKYEQNLILRASIIDAAEKRIEERSVTLQALEAQISSLVDQRTEMEAGQFAGVVAMYETMKPKDAALIFNNLDMEVLLRVAKTMSPRKMAPILAQMDTARAQELTVRMAALADKPAAQMTPNDLAALPQIIGE